MRTKALLFLGVVLLAGCGKNRVLMLTERADEYNRSLKWGSVATCGAMMAETNRKTLMEKVSRNVSANPIVDFSVLDLSTEPGDKKGSALVEFSYYGASDQTLRNRQETQIWQWDSSKVNWFLLDARDVRPGKN